MMGTPSLEHIYPELWPVAELAREAPELAFTTLAHHMDLGLLRYAYGRTRRDGAPGVDGQTAESYEEHLEENLRSLLDRAKSGTYQAPPVRRAHIPKGDGRETRPIGIPTFEDKVLQRAVVTVLEAIYEQDFLDCSYGFRPGRSAHQALEALREQTRLMGGAWLVEVDIRKFFDTLDHRRLREILPQRVRDGVLLRLIGKWLAAGVLEAGSVSYPTAGTPQGGVISPLLANIYLHEVLDKWFEAEVKPRLRGRVFLVRYADDFILGFECEEDARRVLAMLPERFGSFGLTLHPEKTRLVPFVRPPSESGREGPPKGEGPGTFEFLGFTHFWGRSRRGYWVIKRKTARGRFGRALKRVAQWCRAVRHWPVEEQHADLVAKLRGHYAYYGITGNSGALSRFRHAVCRVWSRWLWRRSQRRRGGWDWFNRLLERYPLPPAVAVHSLLRRAASP